MKPHSIRLALILAFTCVIVFVVTMGGLSAWKGAKAEILIEHLYECSLEEEYWSDAMFLSAMALRSGILHPEDGGSIDDEFQEFLHALSRSIEANQNSLRFVVELDEQERIDAAETEVKELLSFYRVVQELAADWRDSVSGAAEAEMEYREQFLTAFDEQIFPRLKAYQENARSSLSREGDEILELVSGFWRTVLVVGVLCIGISIMAGYFLYCRVIGPIRRMAEEVEKVAADNFSDRVEKTGVLEIDRMGSAFNAVMDSLHKANLTGAEMKDLAERRRDELGRVLELVPDIVCAVDSLGGVVEVNRGFEMVLGYSREEILGKNIFDLVHPDDKRRSEAERDIMLVEGRLSVLFENRLKHRDGTWRTISWSSSPSLEDQTVYAVGRDITEMVEVRAEQGRSFQRALQGQQSLMELRDSIRMEKRQFFEKVTEVCSGILQVSRASVWRFYEKEKRAVRIDLYTRKDRVHSGSKTVSLEEFSSYLSAITQLNPVVVNDVYADPVTRDFAEQEYRSLGIFSLLDVPIRAGGELYGIISCEGVDESREWTDEDVKFLTDVAGAILLYLEFAERHEVERKLREFSETLEDEVMKRTADLVTSEERFRMLIEQVQDYAIFMLDPDGRVVTWNAGAERTKGYRTEEILGKHYSCFYEEEDRRANLPENQLTLARTKGRAKTEGVRIKKDGTRFWAEVLISAIYAPDGTLRGFAKVTRDLTERRKAQQVLEKSLETQKELTRQARAGDRAKRDFLAVMSHELRTPMNGIIGFGELLLDSADLTDEDRDCVKTLYDSSQSLLRILDDILDFISSEAGTMRIEEAPFEPRRLLEEVRLLLSPMAEKKGLSLLLDVNPEVPEWLRSDHARLRQILMNLVGNAVKFTEKGFVRFAMSGLETQQEGNWWEITVVDTGPGVAVERRKEIFDPFTQADSSSSRRFDGSGMGLAISRKLAELIGGTLELLDGVEEGAVFVLRLPMEPIEKVSKGESAEESKEAVDPESVVKMDSLKIMVVEDNLVNRKMMMTLLSKLGYDPIFAKDGKEAIEVYRENRPDCIFMDLQMPVMNGIESTEAIRKLEAEKDWRPAFISALTANTVIADRKRCFEAGMSFYLNKPVRREAVIDTLERAKRLFDE